MGCLLAMPFSFKCPLALSLAISEAVRVFKKMNIFMSCQFLNTLALPLNVDGEPSTINPRGNQPH